MACTDSINYLPLVPSSTSSTVHHVLVHVSLKSKKTFLYVFDSFWIITVHLPNFFKHIWLLAPISEKIK